MKLPNFLKSVFWDVSFKDVDSKENKNYIITRVAEKGKFKDVVWLKNQYGKTAIRKAVKSSRNVSLKTKNFWQLI